MTCPRCRQENPAEAHFCMKCGTGLTLACAKCNRELPTGAAFCFACGQPVTAAPGGQRVISPDAYTPRHLAEKILTSKTALEGEQGEVWDKAVRYLRQAGTKVFLRSAHREAVTSLEQALEALRRLPETPDAIAESLDIRFELRNALFPLGETGRMGALLDEAETLAEAVRDHRRLSRALTYKVVQFGLAGDFGAAIQAGLRALAIGESQADVAIQVVANGYLGAAYRARGECREGIRHCEAAIALIPEDLAQERFGQAGIQSSIVRNNLAIALGSVGRFAEAFGRAHEAIHIAEEAGHVYSLIYPLLGLGTLKLDQGDFAGAVAPLERGLDLCRKREIPLLLPDFTWALGAAYHGTGRRAEGVALMEDAARGVAERTVRWSWWAGRLGALGVTYLLAGRLYPEMDMRFWLEKATEMKKMGG